MATREQYFTLLGQMGEVRTQMASLLASQRPEDATAREMLANQLGGLELQLQSAIINDNPVPADGGFAAILGIGDGAAGPIGAVPTPIMVPSYDEAVASERLYAVGDLYYCYQMEQLGMFRAVQKLQELFRAGKLRLDNGEGAFNLYRFDRKEVLRYTFAERTQAYKRVLGYTNSAPPRGARANHLFHSLFSQFNLRVAQLFRDKRIAETFRPGAGPADPSFGSIAMARRAGLDLRNNLKHASFGDVNVLTIELLQIVSAAFDILGAEDIRRQFGTDSGWDTLEEVLQRYLGETPVVSQRSRMGETGRGIIHWLAQSYILTQGRTAFEALVQGIAELSEEWLTSAEALGAARDGLGERSGGGNVVEFRSRRHLSA
jgi:hypothetical protein